MPSTVFSMNNLPETFNDLYSALSRIDSPMQSARARKIISVSENNVCYRLDPEAGSQSAVFRIDNGLIRDTSRYKCDYLVLLASDRNKNDITEIFVELKGTDIPHAIDQVGATIDDRIFRHASFDKKKNVLARIVAKRIPAKNSNPEVERKKRDFIKTHGNILKLISNGRPDKI